MTDFQNINLTNIQSFIKSFPTNDDFLKFLTEKGILFTVDSENGMTILRYNKEHPNCDLTDSFTKFCRGLIIDNETNNIICFPPEKSNLFVSLPEHNFGDLHIEDFIDGTMINLFFHNDQMHISTRSCIGANGKWFSEKKFSDMFVEAQGELNFDNFEKNYTYTFVLRHPENRIVTKYNKADLVLVQVRDMHTFNIINTSIVKGVLKERNIDITIPVNYNFTDLDQLTNYVAQMNWEQQGVVVKLGNFRSKIRNEKYNYVKNMRGNSPRLFYNFIDLRNNKMIKQYLQYFPEYKPEFHEFTNEIIQTTKEIHKTYIDFRVKKIITPDDIPKEIKTLIYELHGFHIKDGITITFDYVKNYFNTLLCFDLGNVDVEHIETRKKKVNIIRYMRERLEKKFTNSE